MTRRLPIFHICKTGLLAFVILSLASGVPGAFAQEQPAQEAEAVPDFSQVQSPAEPASPIENLAEITGTSIELTAIPPRLGDDGTLTGDPGTTIQAQVRVRNNSGESISVDTLVEDFIIGDDGVTPVAVDVQPNSLWSLASWIQVGNARNTIAPFGSATIPIIIQVPDTALPGGRYAMIMHQPASVADRDTSGETAGKTGISQRVGTLVYFRVNGEIKEAASIRNIKIPFLTEFGPVPISFEIENMSDIHIQPMSKITIKNMIGQTSEVLEVSTKNVFPYTSRSFETEWDRVWGFGRYTATIDASYGSQGKVAQAVFSFWLVPYKLIIAIFMVLIAVVGIVVAVRRHLMHRNSVENQHVTLLEDRIQQLEQELQRRK